MKRVLLDLNVVLDVLLDRKPHSEASGAVWSAVENGAVEGGVSAHALTTMFYLVARPRGAHAARRVIGDVVSVFKVAAVDETVIHRALALSWQDFEDAVSAAAAEATSCDAIVTRDRRGFPDSSVPILDP